MKTDIGIYAVLYWSGRIKMAILNHLSNQIYLLRSKQYATIIISDDGEGESYFDSTNSVEDSLMIT